MTKLGAAVTPAEPDLAPARVTPAQALSQLIDRWAPVIQRLLPKGHDLDRFKAVLADCARRDPNLLRCEPGSFVAAAIKAAKYGLEPNDERGLCYFIPRGGKVVFQLGYRGKAELAMRHPKVYRITMKMVREGDEFEYDEGTTQRIAHRPKLPSDPGAQTYVWYAVAFDPNGQVLDVAVLDRARAEYHRSWSSQKDGQLWVRSYDVAAMKSAVHDLMKLVPQSEDYRAAVADDGRTFHLAELGPEPDHEAEDVGEANPDGVPCHCGQFRVTRDVGVLSSGISHGIDECT